MNFGFLSTFFCEKPPKMFKTDFILANVAFFVKIISRKNAAATVARGPVPRERSIHTKNVAWNVARGPVPRDLPTETKTVCSPEVTNGFC